MINYVPFYYKASNGKAKSVPAFHFSRKHADAYDLHLRHGLTQGHPRHHRQIVKWTPQSGHQNLTPRCWKYRLRKSDLISIQLSR